MESIKNYVLDYFNNNPTKIYLEGLISGGKSTLCRSIDVPMTKNNIAYRYYKEPINEKLLKLFYSNIKKYAFDFQTITIRERVHVDNEATDFLLNGGKLAIIDRSCFGDAAFALMHHDANNINDEELDVYSDLIKNNKIKKCEHKQFLLYLNCTPRKCRQRVITRGNSDEIEKCDINYLEKLDQYYDKVLEHKPSNQIEKIVLDILKEQYPNLKIIYIDYETDYEIKDGVLSEQDTLNILYQFIKLINN